MPTPSPLRSLLPSLSVVAIVATASLAVANDPAKRTAHPPRWVAERIDRFIDGALASEQIPASPIAEDAQFLRRAYLDITGRVPPVADAENFLDDSDGDKRRKLVDRLLDSHHYGERFATVWHHLFAGRDFGMARPPDTRLLAKWLAGAFAENRAWDQLVRDLLTAEGSHAKQPSTIFFTLNGNSRGLPQPNILTGTIGQLFLGVQLQCAECHDHPFTEWTQSDFWSLAAFFDRVTNPPKPSKKKKKKKSFDIRAITETPLKPGDVPSIKIPAASFTNVGQKVPARFPDIGEPAIGKEASLRKVLAEWLTSPENPYFARNSVNRLWAHFFGRGLANPLNDLRKDRRPSHPALLDFLAREFAESGFDQKHLIRCLCATKAYQRTSAIVSENSNDDSLLSHMRIKVLSPEMLLDSLSTAVGGEVLSAERPKMNFRNPLLPLYSPREEFLQLFDTARKDGDPTRYTHGVPQILFLMNTPQLNRGAPVVARLIKDGVNARHGIEHLYLATLSRRPTDKELADAGAFVQRQSGLREGFDGVLWTLLNRSEFIVNR